MTNPEEEDAYRLAGGDDQFQVVDSAGGVVVSGSEEANVRQYVALLNEAYRRGYKAGYKRAKALTR